MTVIKQIIRGCGYLPGVGEHPGTMWMVAFILMGGMAGVMNKNFDILIGIVGGMVFMGIFIIPIYLYGAYDRANLSDELSKKDCK